MAERCTCISYNRPEPYQTTPEVVLSVPVRFGWHKETVCVDACIAGLVQQLWDANIWTLGSCCGHNVEADRAVIVDRTDREKAATVIRTIGDSARILAWELVEGYTYSTQRATP